MTAQRSRHTVVPVLDQHERAMIAFAAMWLPFGGADDLIFPEFGLSVGEFHARLLDLIDNPSVDEFLESEQLVELRCFCRIKLAGSLGRRPLRSPGSRGPSSAAPAVRAGRPAARPA